jgi:hypothetical protein
MERYAREWEENEYSLGRSEFLNLFNYIRMIFVKSRSKKLLHEEILEELDQKPKIKEFLEQELPLYCDLYFEILNPKEVEVRNIVKVLEATNQKDWVAPVLFMLKHKAKLGNRFLPILKHLAAISLMMLCAPFTEGQRVGRYGRILVELENLVIGKIAADKMIYLLAGDEELSRIEQNLFTNAYALRNIRAFLLWSETLVGDGERSIESEKMTVEHLLPQSVGQEEYWVDRFGDKWQHYANHIGNLVLVSRRMNARLARRSFPDKKATIKKRVKAGWTITDQALENADWTPDLIENRGRELLRRARGAMRSPLQ